MGKRTEGLSCLETASGMVIARSTLVVPSPPGPSEQQRDIVRGRPDQVRKQVTHLRSRQWMVGDLWLRVIQPCCLGRLILCTQTRQKGQSKHHEGDMSIPGGPGAYLIVPKNLAFLVQPTGCATRYKLTDKKETRPSPRKRDERN